MQQTKRHHFVPKAYLRAFCGEKGQLLVYRKDEPTKPFRTSPDGTQFHAYYYSQPLPGGGRDNNTLESFFSSVEQDWPETVARLHRRENVNDRLSNIFEFMTLQRVRVPAARDVIEAALARTVKDTMKIMLANGTLPPPPPGLEELPNLAEVAIDPHRSIHAMAAQIQGMGKLFSRIGLSAVHNSTGRPFLTSDNPVIWFDPSVAFEEQHPYAVDPIDGPVFLLFPVSPRLALIGSTENKASFGEHGLLHGDMAGGEQVALINAQICRFAHEAIIANGPGQEEIVEEFAELSPVHDAFSVPLAMGIATVHRQVFGKRRPKPKWKDG